MKQRNEWTFALQLSPVMSVQLYHTTYTAVLLSWLMDLGVVRWLFHRVPGGPRLSLAVLKWVDKQDKWQMGLEITREQYNLLAGESE